MWSPNNFIIFCYFFENQIDSSIHVLRIDPGGEYNFFELFCKEQGVARQRSDALDQASNDKADRIHRTIMDMARCIIYSCILP